MRLRQVISFFASLLIVGLTTAAGKAASILGEEWDKFLKERVTFGGFVENITGLSVAAGDAKFSTSNRFIMNRFTIQPEFNIDIADSAKLFISWKFVKEPRYNKEAKDRASNTPPLPPLDNTFYDQDSPKPWELVLDVIPTDRLSFRWGRQFISWGETDGIRLLDVINPQDGRFSPPVAPNLFNLDETRIPSWGLRVFYTLVPATNTALELIAMPGFDEKKQRVDESAPVAGRWAPHPETRVPLGNLFANPLPGSGRVIPSTSREYPSRGDNWKLGGRVTHTVGKLSLGLGYIWGYNPQSTDLVFKHKGNPFLLGASTVIPLALVNDRTSIYAAHFNYPIESIKTALKGELAFYPSKPYNISEFPGRDCKTGALTGFTAGPSCSHPSGITEKHTLRYSLGLDSPVLVPWLHPDDPWRAFNFSFQLFQGIIFNHEDGIRVFATAAKIRKVSNALTLRVSTGYLGDTILPDVFVGYDPEGYWVANPAVSYVPPWNERIKLSLIAAIYGGHNKFNSFGSFAEKDSIFLKMRYQF